MAIIRIIKSPTPNSWHVDNIGKIFKVQRFIPQFGLAKGPTAVVDFYDDRLRILGPPYTCSCYAAFGEYELLNDCEEVA